MKKWLPFLPIGYVINAILVAWFVGQTVRQVLQGYRANSPEMMQVSAVSWIPLITLLIVSATLISMFLCIAYFLSVRRRRRAVLIMAGISCLGVPVGTILGGLTIYALTRPEVSAEFTPNN